MAKPLFSPERLQELKLAAIEARLSRNALLAGLDRSIVSSLPGAPTPAEHLLSDVTELSYIGALSDGTVPLRSWLSNAIALCGLLRQARTFQAALAELDAKLAGAPWAQATYGLSTDSKAPVGAGAGAFDAGVPGKGLRNPVRIYVCSAPEDARLVALLERHLAILTASGAADLWHRGRVPPGSNAQSMAAAEIPAAHVVLLLVSPDFLADPFANLETRLALDVARYKKVQVVPVLARPSMWKESSFASFEALPRSQVPLTSALNPDEALTEVAEQLTAIVKALRPG